MKNSIKTLLFFTVVISLVAASCTSDDSELVKEGGPFKINELAGNWEATSAIFNSDNDNESVDIIADGGSLSLTVQSTGSFTMTINPVDRQAYTESGEMFWELYEGEYYFAIAWDSYPNDWSSYGATLNNGSNFFMNGGPSTGEYDFNNDGDAQSAGIGFAFVKL